MPVGSGLAAQVGIANETTVNTPVAVSTFTRTRVASFDRRPNRVQGVGLGDGGLAPDLIRYIETSHDAGGPIEFDVPTKGFGKWLQAMFGSYSTTATQIASTTAWQQIHNPASADGKTFTCQAGIPSTDGTVNPLTLSGCKLTDWTLTASQNAIVSLAATVDAMDIAPTGAGALGLQTASFSATEGIWGFNQITATTFSAYTTVSGVLTPTSPTSPGVVRNITLKGGQPKDNTRWQAGSVIKAEALTNDRQPVTGTLDIDFGSMTLYNQFAANTSIGIFLSCIGSLAGGANPFTLNFVMPACVLGQGSTPQFNGPGVVTVSYPYTALRDSLGNFLQAVYISTDTTV